jgi:high-affinity nickel-transport protein
VLPNPFDDRPSPFKTKTAITYAFFIAVNLAAWTWALIAFIDQPVLLGTAFGQRNVRAYRRRTRART